MNMVRYIFFPSLLVQSPYIPDKNRHNQQMSVPLSSILTLFLNGTEVVLSFLLSNFFGVILNF